MVNTGRFTGMDGCGIVYDDRVISANVKLLTCYIEQHLAEWPNDSGVPIPQKTKGDSVFWYGSITLEQRAVIADRATIYANIKDVREVKRNWHNVFDAMKTLSDLNKQFPI